MRNLCDRLLLMRCGPALAALVLASACPTAPSVVSPTPAPIRSHVSAGFDQACVLLPDGEVRCWGRQYEPSDDTPLGLAPVPNAEFRTVSVGGYHSCGLTTVGDILCWGAVEGDPLDGSSYTEVSVGPRSGCALEEGTGHIDCWHSAGDRYRPSESRFTSISGRCGIRTDRTIECWDESLDVPPPGEFVQVSQEHLLGCAIDLEGGLSCWGQYDSLEPGEFAPPAGAYVEVDVGYNYACARTGSGATVCWGAEWGDSLQTPGGHLLPPAGSAFRQISAAFSYACGLTFDEEVECWGFDDAGAHEPDL